MGGGEREREDELRMKGEEKKEDSWMCGFDTSAAL